MNIDLIDDTIDLRSLVDESKFIKEYIALNRFNLGLMTMGSAIRFAKTMEDHLKLTEGLDLKRLFLNRRHVGYFDSVSNEVIIYWDDSFILDIFENSEKIYNDIYETLSEVFIHISDISRKRQNEFKWSKEFSEMIISISKGK